MTSETDSNSGRKAAEEGLRADETGFRSLFNAIGEMVLVGTPDGRLLFTNAAVSRSLGYSPDELSAMHMLEIYPKDRRQEAEVSFAAMFRGERCVCTLPLAKKDGTPVPVEIRTSVGKWNGEDCIFGIAWDLSAEQEAQDHFERLFLNYPVPMTLGTGPYRKFTDVNDAFLSMVGYSRSEVIGRSSKELGLYPHPHQEKEVAELLRINGRIAGFELQFLCKDGTLRDGLFSCETITRRGRQEVLAFLVDITERKRTENALRENRELLRIAFNTTADGILVVDGNGKVSHVNRRFVEMWRVPWDVQPGDDDSKLFAFVSEQMEEPDCFRARVRELYQSTLEGWDEISLRDGRVFERYSSPMRIGGEVTGRVWDFHDITERKQREDELKAWMDRYNLIVEASGQVAYEYDIHTGNVTWGGSIQKVLGYSLTEINGGIDQWAELIHPEDLPSTLESLETAKNACAFMDSKYRMRHKLGHYVWVRDRGFFLPDRSGRACKQLGMVENITDHVRAESALRESEERYRAIFNAVSDAVFLHDVETGQILDANDAMLRMYAFASKDDALRWSLEDLCAGSEAYNIDEALRKIRLAAAGRPQVFEWLAKKRTGETFWVEAALRVSPISGRNRVLAVVRDITERKKTEKIMRLVQYGVERARDSVIWLNRERRFVSVNEATCLSLGYSREELLAMKISDIDPDALPERFERHLAELRKGRSITFETRLHTKDGRIFPVEVTSSYVLFEGQEGTFSFVRDITERKRAEEEREKLQSQLFQAQKMESVGRLAGGVAHDFNNMLGVIVGNVEMALMKLEPTQPIYNDLQQVLKAAHRSAALTRQLLAFARMQTISPMVLDLNKTLEGMLKMLRRLIGENIDLAWQPGAGLWQVKMDPVQVDQILVNLCVNAKDAIAEIGKITIETANAVFDETAGSVFAGCASGEYVMLSVRDSGSGMDKDTKAMIFEPFFTTKGLGQGTGLGLATVYGIVKQNNGFINVYSEPGQGTVFRVYIPRHVDEAVEKIEAKDATKIPRGRGETILVVEDEPPILDMVQKMLASQGYSVLAAAIPDEAIRMAGEYSGEIDMLITDMVMPGMNGKELAERLQATRPSMKCLFMSGYMGDTIAPRDTLEKGINFIQKPFSMKALAVKIREVLGIPGA